MLGAVLAAGAIYVCGWSALSRRNPERFGPGRLAAFLAGLGVIVLAVASPLDILASQRLWAHMTQHQLLMMGAPPLLWLGAPLAPILCGLPRGIRRAVAAGLAAPTVRLIARAIEHPATGWVSFAIAFWAWHTPWLYDLALRSHGWHHVEHACFFATAMLFWRPVILARPARSPWPRWTMIPYLLLADLQNTVLAAILTFTDRVIYPAYATIPRAGTISGLDDQSIAGVIMWVSGSLIFLLAMVWLVMEALKSPEQRRRGLEIRRFEALGEPTVDRCQELRRRVGPPLVMPQPSEAGGAAQLQG
jgi:cytochrome c oxidase assembly factor CtaG